MCPNCVLNQSAPWVWLGPALICLLFMIFAGFFMYQAKKSGVFEGDEEDAKYAVFED